MTARCRPGDLDVHRISGAAFDALAVGGGAVAGPLRDGQLSKRMLLLRAVVDTARERVPGVEEQTRIGAHFAALSSAQSADRPAVDGLLLHPQVGLWATECLRQMFGSTPARSLLSDLCHLGGVAAAASLRAGARLDTALTVRAPGGRLMLPGYGLARVPDGAGLGPWVRITVRDGVAWIDAGPDGQRIQVAGSGAGSARTGWSPLRRLRSEVDGVALDVILDDLDPYRGFGEMTLAGRLGPCAVARWQTRLDEAWTVLVRHHPDFAETISTGLASLVPLRPQGDHAEVSASSAEAYGAAALTLPATGLGLAAALVHEGQHMKLSALLDLVRLHTADRTAAFYAPWRGDPRPLSGLFQGTYAYLGVVDFWRTQRRHAAGSDHRIADFEVARWHGQVGLAIASLATSGALTVAGTRFVAGMRARLDAMNVGDLGAEERRLAADAVADHRTAWRLRNLRPGAEQVAGWADAWESGLGCPGAAQVAVVASPAPHRFVAGTRTALAYLRLRQPGRFAELAGDPVRLAAEVTGDDPPDVAVADARLVSGDAVGAARGYLDAVAGTGSCLPAWTGLSLARRRTAANPAAAAADPLVSAPELVYALHTEISARRGAGPDPDQVAAWLSATSGSADG